ncbi:MAG: septal ring lytic transglycosylase RlpA family protein [Actinomycetota bacterium]
MGNIRTRTALVLALALLVLATPVFAHRKYQRGEAIYYANEFAGGGTACGGTYDPTAKTAAHRKLPCGSRVRVKNLANGNRVIVTITDEGPFVDNDDDAIIDVSRKAAKRLGFWGSGRAEVRLVVLELGPED